MSFIHRKYWFSPQTMRFFDTVLPLLGAVLVLISLGVIIVVVVGLLSSRRNIPADVYEREAPHLGGIRYEHWFVIFGVLGTCVIKIKAFQHPPYDLLILALQSIVFFALVAWRLMWTRDIRRRRAELDPQLVRFAHYSFWLTLIGIPIALWAVEIRATRLIHAMSVPSRAPCVAELKIIDGAKQQWALENHKTANDLPSWDDVLPYLDKTFAERHTKSDRAICPDGGTYTLGRVGEKPTCSLGGPQHLLE